MYIGVIRLDIFDVSLDILEIWNSTILQLTFDSMYQLYTTNFPGFRFERTNHMELRHAVNYVSLQAVRRANVPVAYDSNVATGGRKTL